MNTPHIQTSHAYGETPPNTYPDFEWARTHEAELLEQYGECVLIIYERQVLGSGQTIAEAEVDAERHLPAESGVITPITVYLHYRHPFRRVRPTKQTGE